MPEEVKFTKEELKQVQNIQSSYASVQNQFGQLKLAQLRLDEQEIQLKDSLNKICLLISCFALFTKIFTSFLVSFLLSPFFEIEIDRFNESIESINIFADSTYSFIFFSISLHFL